ncbi:hypothetical protein ACFXAZ_22590 [Streptomyces sp. NPDC059477]|uniref:hypothetical protein n=1 Tax=Streptomyces sp. NPDC059477 TaxID=3346847 RepID=UPI003699963A
MLVTTPDDYDALRDESHQNRYLGFGLPGTPLRTYAGARLVLGRPVWLVRGILRRHLGHLQPGGPASGVPGWYQVVCPDQEAAM